jgi:hypothetical protein
MIDRYINKSVTAWLTSNGSLVRGDAQINQAEDEHGKAHTLSEGPLDRGNDQGAIHNTICGTGYERSTITLPGIQVQQSAAETTSLKQTEQQPMHGVTMDVHSPPISLNKSNAPSTQKNITAAKHTGRSPSLTLDGYEHGGAVTQGTGTSARKSNTSNLAQPFHPDFQKHSDDKPRSRAQKRTIKARTKMLIGCASTVQPEYEGVSEMSLTNQPSSASMDNLIPESAVQAHDYVLIDSQNVCCD